MLRLPPLACLALACTSPSALAQSSVAEFWGSTPGLEVGTAMDEVGDLNGDGYVDMVVGAPHPGGVGAIYFVSGKYLETGSGSSTLGSTFGTGSNLRFGTSVVSVGDVTGDGVEDVCVGEPNIGGANDGYVHLVSGASKAIVRTVLRPTSKFGASLARCGDVDGDGHTEIVIGCPSAWTGGAGFTVASPRKLWLNTVWSLKAVTGMPSGFATAVSGGDVDGDGQPEFVIGSPNEDRTYVYQPGLSSSPSDSVVYVSSSAFGTALDASRDFDGDGYDDIVVGAPEADVAFLLSGAAITAGSGLQSALNVDLARWTGQANTRFGFSVTTTPDTNFDFVADIVIGAPDVDLAFPQTLRNGAIHFISGDTLAQMGIAVGDDAFEHLGTAVSRAWDYDNDLRFEIAAGAPLSGHAATQGGIVRFYSLFPAPALAYCTGKLNSQGCTPAIHPSASFASLSSSSPCNVTATSMINQKPGMLLYSLDPAATPFQGGYLCLAGPIKRVGVQSTLGNPPPNDCSGTMTYDMNARIQSGADPALGIAGQEIFCQWWARDPAGIGGSALSNALHLVVNP